MAQLPAGDRWVPGDLVRARRAGQRRRGGVKAAQPAGLTRGAVPPGARDHGDNRVGSFQAIGPSAHILHPCPGQRVDIAFSGDLDTGGRGSGCVGRGCTPLPTSHICSYSWVETVSMPRSSNAAQMQSGLDYADGRTSLPRANRAGLAWPRPRAVLLMKLEAAEPVPGERT